MMRTRSRGGLVPKTYAYNEIDFTCSSGIVGRTDNLPDEVNSLETMTDTVTSKFKQRSAQGEVFFNPMSHSILDCRSSGGIGWKIRKLSPLSCSSPVKYGVTDTIGDSYPAYLLAQRSGVIGSRSYIPPAVLLSSQDIADACTQASTQALANIDTGDTNLVESVAEIHQSLDLAGQSLQQVNHVLSKVPIRALKGVTNAYLLYRYGMRPLISDMNAILKHMSTVTERRRRTSRGYATLDRDSVTTFTTVLGGTSSVSHLAHDHDSVSVRATSLVEYVVSRERELGFTAKNLLTLPWELIPYSFVVDYYVNVGNYLRALSPTPGVSLLGSCLVQERTSTSTVIPTGTSFVGANYSVERQVSGGYVSSLWTKTRGAVSTPGLVINSDFRFNNLSRCLDQAALVVQRLISRHS